MKKYLLIPIIVGVIQVNAESLERQANRMFATLPSKMKGSEADTPELIALGKQLYFETALSINDSQSCNSCHNIKANGAGVDNETTSPGALKKRGDRNSPTTWNAGLHVAQFWDGRAPSLEEQAKGPILNPIEMAIPTEKVAIERLNRKGYETSFAVAFPNKKNAMTYDNIATAIAAYERTLISNDRFDKYLRGNNSALTTQEKLGLKKFMDIGCVSCHNGALLGANVFMKMGIVNSYPNVHDKGKYNVTKNPGDAYIFKVPSLRMVGQTAPYFHDGKAETLEDAVKEMAFYQLGRQLEKEDVDDLAAFLRSLDNITR
jgi:cytochrome c peroxidase